jgi:hypothetical protein
VLASARLAAGGWVVATGSGLATAGLRLSWNAIARAEWDADSSTLVIEPVDGATAEGGRLSLPLDRPGHLPEVVRERVTDSIVTTRHVAVHGSAGVQVVARRTPGSDEIVWQVVVDAGLDPESPVMQEAVGATIAELSAELGR